MKSNRFKFAIIILTVGILSACGSQSTAAPASAPTEASVPATQAPSNPQTDPTTSSQATEAPTAASAGPASVSFTNDVLPIFENRCLNCHGGERTSEGLSLKTYAAVMAGSDNGPVISAGNANNSLLAQLIYEGKMPKRGPKLTPDQVQVITNWITQGAQNN